MKDSPSFDSPTLSENDQEVYEYENDTLADCDADYVGAEDGTRFIGVEEGVCCVGVWISAGNQD